jgi:hypothetical protein
VLLSHQDWETHAFPTVPPGKKARRAACGAKVSAEDLENNGESVAGCQVCALAVGTQLAHARAAREQEIRDKIDVEVAKVAAKKITVLITAAGGLSGQGHAKALRDLRGESQLVRAWVRWNRVTRFSFPLSGVLLASGISEVATDAVVGWTVPSLLVGTSFLLVTVLGLARGNHHALQVALGVQRRVTPDEIEHDPLAGATGELPGPDEADGA